MPNIDDYPELAWGRHRRKGKVREGFAVRAYPSRSGGRLERLFISSGLVVQKTDVEHENRAYASVSKEIYGNTSRQGGGRESVPQAASPEGLCNTLRAGTGSEKGAFTSPRPIHPHMPRVITVREAARLHSYPDWFRAAFDQVAWLQANRQFGSSSARPGGSVRTYRSHARGS